MKLKFKVHVNFSLILWKIKSKCAKIILIFEISGAKWTQRAFVIVLFNRFCPRFEFQIEKENTKHNKLLPHWAKKKKKSRNRIFAKLNAILSVFYVLFSFFLWKRKKAQEKKIYINRMIYECVLSESYKKIMRNYVKRKCKHCILSFHSFHWEIHVTTKYLPRRKLSTVESFFSNM